jgi:large subunit ribosomal protein L15
MKLHDLRPAEGSRTAKTRVGRGIAAGKGKTAGRGTKGQKARAGGSIPPWFEGGQTPLHMRIPKLRGFKNRFKIEYEVVNVGAIAAAAERGAFETSHSAGGKGKAPVTVNQDILRAVGLVRTLNKPLKILGAGELATPLVVVADAFTASARSKIEAAGGTVSVLEIPGAPRKALGLDATETSAEATAAPATETPEPAAETAKPTKARKPKAAVEAAPAEDAAAPEAEDAAAPEAEAVAAEPDADAETPAATATEDELPAPDAPSGDDA